MMNFIIRISSVVEPEFWNRKNKNPVLSAVYLVFLYFKYFRKIVSGLKGDFLVIPRLEIAITSRCSLKCKYCASMMQFYDNPYDVDTELNILSLRKILDSADQVNQLKILGGEPLMDKNLYMIIDEALKHDNVRRILIITNGTIVPQSEELISSLANDRVSIRISYYGEDVSKRVEAIKQLCNEKGINCYAKWEKEMWKSAGRPYKRNKSISDLKRQYRRCSASLCNNLLAGKLHHCSRSSNGMNMGVIPVEQEDYLDVMRDMTREDFRKELQEFVYHDRGYIIACDYCDLATRASYDVAPGEQC